MSKYTTELRFICENYAGLNESKGYNNVDDIISKSWKKIFDFDFPIFNEVYREILCTKIIKHYYTREICAETVGRWKLFLQSKMLNIMPYYNKLYESEFIIDNPLENTNYKRTYTKNNDEKTDYKDNGTKTINTDENVTNNTTSNSNGTTNDNGTRYDLHSDTPQGALDGVDTETYLTYADKSTNNDTTITTNSNTTNRTGNDKIKTDEVNNKNGNTNSSGLEKFEETIKGKTGSESVSKILLEYRKTLINVDICIINELRDLFFNLW